MPKKDFNQAKEEFNEMLNEIERTFKPFKTLDPPQVDWQLYALLKRLGLNKYEIHAYISLVMEHPQTITQLSKNTAIPQPRAYDVLGSLVKYGLAEENTQSSGKYKRRTKIFRPLPPEEGLGNLMSFFEYAKEEALEHFKRVVEPIKATYGGIWEIKNKVNLINAAKRVINEAESEILVVSEFTLLEHIIRDLKKVHNEKNITISLVTKYEDVGSRNEDLSILTWISFLKLKYRRIFSMPYMIVDRKYALQWNTHSFTGQEVENIHIIQTLIDHFFFSNWQIGKRYSRMQELEMSRKYPLALVNIQTAIDEINLIDNPLNHPQVEVHGYLSQSGEKIHVKGEVIRTDTNWSSGTFSILLKTDNGEELTIGGMLASIESITAEKFIIYENKVV